MGLIETIKLVGQNGHEYLFDVYPKQTTFDDVLCLYAFLTPVLGGYHVLYIGQTIDLVQRLANHHKWVEASQHGFMYVAVCRDVTLLSLDADEENLIRHYSPVCNQQLCNP